VRPADKESVVLAHIGHRGIEISPRVLAAAFGKLVSGELAGKAAHRRRAWRAGICVARSRPTRHPPAPQLGRACALVVPPMERGNVAAKNAKSYGPTITADARVPLPTLRSYP